MNAIKGGWVGQTFALAKSNDTGGKKARIRRTKEERKAMVESFIKKFQKSNDGNFPSLNLTHKEVGGSFYIVREIVREIIQENRVLGPAKLTPEEWKNVGLLEQYPLGTISTAPQSDLLISNGTEVLLANHSHRTSGEQDMVNLNEHFSEPGYKKPDNGKIADGIIEEVGNDVVSDGPIITHVSPRDYQATSEEEDIELEEEFGKPGSQKINNGHVNGISQAVEESNASDVPITIHVASLDEQATSDSKDIDSGEELGRPEIHGIDNGTVVNESNLAVEKGRVSDELLYTVSEVREALDVDASEAKQVNTESTRRAPTTGDVMVETFPLRPVPQAINGLDRDSAEQGKYYGTSKENDTENVELEAGKNSSIESSSLSTEQKVKPNQKSLLSDGDIGSVDEKAAVTVVHSAAESLNLCSSTKGLDLAVKDSASIEIKPASVLNGLHAENVKDTNNNGIHEQPISEEAVAVKNKSDILITGSSHEGGGKTLDRIYLESWERTTEKSARPETNSLLALFKAFISALVKFWVE